MDVWRCQAALVSARESLGEDVNSTRCIEKFLYVQKRIFCVCACGLFGDSAGSVGSVGLLLV